MSYPPLDRNPRPTCQTVPQVGGEEPHRTDDPLVVLLYLLLRDHLNAGIFERLVHEMESAAAEGKEGSSLTNRFLGEYAENLAERLRVGEQSDGRST